MDGRQDPGHYELLFIIMDELPSDVLAIVFSFLSGKALASAAAVSRNWRHLASSDSLWEDLLRSEDPEGWPMVLFAETQLRLGRGSRPNDGETLAGLPWSGIYRLRAQLPPALVVDVGSGYCKFGMSSGAAPSRRIATFRESGNIEAPSLARRRALFASIYDSMRVIPSNHPVVVSEPLAFLPETREAQERRRRVREMTCAVLFKAFRVPSICLVDQATLALFAAGAASGVVVNIGFNNTTILPIMRGRTACSLLPFYCLPLGAMRVTGHLTQLLHERGMACKSMSTVHTIKESLCFVARDFEAAMGEERGVRGTCEVPGEGAFTLARERFLAPEVLFRPSLCRLGCKGIQYEVARCILECVMSLKAFLKARHSHAGGAAAAVVDKRAEEGGGAPGEGRGDEGASRRMGSADGAAAAGGGERERAPVTLRSKDVGEAISNVVLAGGTSALPGIAERLHLELKRLLPPRLTDHLSVKAVGPYGTWMGGRTLATSSSFLSAWALSREEYMEKGPSSVHAHAMDAHNTA
ncbi:unnamed protein product [Closterium sp. Yama58-4]|nr:unnamed protein product [Closterium sp. Yama58-4]